MKKNEKTCSFCIPKQRNPKCYFFEFFFLKTYLQYQFYYFINPIEVSNSTWLGESFDIKFEMIFFLKVNLMLFWNWVGSKIEVWHS
jgi:hypothetical protein